MWNKILSKFKNWLCGKIPVTQVQPVMSEKPLKILELHADIVMNNVPFDLTEEDTKIILVNDLLPKLIEIIEIERDTTPYGNEMVKTTLRVLVK